MTKPILDYSNFSLQELESILDVALHNHGYLVATAQQRLASAQRIVKLQKAIEHANND